SAGHSRGIRGVVTIIVLVSMAVLACLLHWWSTRSNASPADGPPPLFYPLDTQPLPPLQTRSNGNGHGPPRPAANHATRPVAHAPVVEPPRTNHRPRVAPHDDETENGETIRFVRPSDLDDAVQLLPGRLEVLEGATPHREIRFMRMPGEPAHVILGRE